MRRALPAAALALVCGLVLAGCDLKFSLGFGSGSDGSFSGSELTVPVLYASGEKGGVTSQRITADSADGGELSIDITENDVSGVDPVTQSATWTAVTAATLLTGARPDTAYTFGFDARIATPAAGAVTAVGVLALYYGTEVQSGVALTGAVTPLGAVSPVAGLPEQISAAIEAGGIDTILIPAGQRTAVDADGTAVDLDQLAATGGMTVTEVADIASAYSVMTGEDLPEGAFPTPPPSPSPLSTAEDASTAPVAVAAAVDDALDRARSSLDSAPESTLADRARAAIARSEQLRETNDTGGAWAAASTAADTAAAAAAPALSPAEAVTLAADATTTADALLDELSDAPSTLDDADSVLTAIGWAADARALADQAQTFLAADADPSLAPAGLTSAALASSSVQTARALADLRGEVEGAGGLASEADLDGLASLLRRAAVAATDAYDARRGDSPVASDDLNGLRTIAFEAARDELGTRADEGGAWLALGVANAAFARSSAALSALSAVRVPDGVDPSDAIAQRIGIADEYTVRAVDALTATGATLPLLRGALTDAAAAAASAPVPGASGVFTTPFLRARVLAFAGGVQRD
ncbi:S16 family serine protease [uncultured Microbacterium sp.]|uniref:S16 family serine protease n=1 Tax=uncultured Microbacterium sp. TaxID=191216 RepID=UPI002602E00F|nr:S16 family serine protease [uncultured Microbacterium sp.]